MKRMKLWGIGAIASLLCLSLTTINSEAGVLTAGKQHIGTFAESTTFTTSSSNGINPGLFIEVRDADGRLKEYTSEDGVITVPNTKEGAYVTQAKFLGKTKYVDQDTGEILDTWEEGRNLKLESSKMPVLMTVGKNTFNIKNKGASRSGWYSIPLEIPFNGEVYVKIADSLPSDFRINLLDINGNEYVLTNKEIKKGHTAYYQNLTNIGFYCPSLSIEGDNRGILDDLVANGDIVIDVGGEPYKSNILTVNEEAELREIGGVQDELNLITGELTQRIGEYQITGEENWSFSSSTRRLQIENPTFIPNIEYNIYEVDTFVCDKLKAKQYNDGSLHATNGTYYMGFTSDNWLRIILGEDLNSLAQGKEWLKANKPTIQYRLKTESIKTVDLTSTYKFNLVGDSVLQVEGNVVPTIYSITVPTEPLTFAINPNAEEGQQFIAPDFSITNESKGPVRLELKSFRQTTNIFNDVLPNEHENWDLLTLNQSKDIALALVPKVSDGWLTLDESPKYVATTSNTIIGEIKPATTVDFSFLAFHGKVFDQNLSPKYQLVFTFGF